ncbi:hypothetical protein OIU76_000651 [Salix suchowensis]|nr:hypothetical protein OIU76_000651 [Salix suchowensis]
MIDDPNSKQRYLKNTIEAARRATELSPNSIEFAHFYANLLYEAANDGKEYEEVMKECDRALKIENPIDPAKESLQEESQQKIATAEGRIAHVQGELKNLQQKSNIASISTWMKNLGNGEEIRLIPIRRATEDPMEVSEENKSWRFWVCCRCNEKFVDSDSHLHHVVHKHMGSLMPKMHEVLPQSPDNEWIEMINSCS